LTIATAALAALRADNWTAIIVGGLVGGALYTLGEHGYDPKTPEMMGVFLAAGPDFRRGVRLEARENRTLHDLLIRLLRLPATRTTTVSEFGLTARY